MNFKLQKNIKTKMNDKKHTLQNKINYLKRNLKEKERKFQNNYVLNNLVHKNNAIINKAVINKAVINKVDINKVDINKADKAKAGKEAKVLALAANEANANAALAAKEANAKAALAAKEAKANAAKAAKEAKANAAKDAKEAREARVKAAKEAKVKAALAAKEAKAALAAKETKANAAKEAKEARVKAAKAKAVKEAKDINKIIIDQHVNTNRFIIQTTPYLKNIGETIVDCLNSLGLDAVCQDTEKIKINIRNENFNKSDIFIFLYVKQLLILPDNGFYIFNLEQFYRFKNTIYLDTDRKDKDFLDEAYEKCLGIFDYAMGNLDFYPEKWEKKLHYLPIPLYNLKFHLNSINKPLEKKYDILFFGDKNHRRKKIITYLSNNTNLKIKYVTRTFGNELNTLIQASHIFLNIHYEEKSLLEVARLHDILRINNKAIIISEKSVDKDTMEKYKEVVFFVPEIKDNLENIETLEILLVNILYKIKKEGFFSINNIKKDLDKINKNIVSTYNNTFTKLFRNE